MSLKSINLKDLKLGLRLGADVESSKGIVLAKKEQLVNARLLEVFKSFGVINVVVSEEDEKNEDPMKGVDPQWVDKVKDRFKNLNLQSKMIESLFKCCVERLSKSKQTRLVSHERS